MKKRENISSIMYKIFSGYDLFNINTYTLSDARDFPSYNGHTWTGFDWLCMKTTTTKWQVMECDQFVYGFAIGITCLLEEY